ncbi:MAG: T9SS type A sorting domain-containing protein [Bacteroidia bacterium]|nr:T9SS type A sorting domain-containing protein [Bacteroidia bacterium]
MLKTVGFLNNVALLVYNSFGQLVKQITNISEQTTVFNRGNLSSGLYYIQFIKNNTTIAIDKLFITD